MSAPPRGAARHGRQATGPSEESRVQKVERSMPFLPAPVVPSVPTHLTLRAALMPRRHHALGGGPFHFRHLASVATYLQPA